MTAPGGDLTGAISAALAVINSVQVGAIRDLARRVGDAGARSAEGGRTLISSAEDVGAQPGDPYVAYHGRLLPVGNWMSRFEQPATDAAAKVTNAATVAEQAQIQAKSIAASLSPPTLATILMYPEALEQLNALIATMSESFGAIQPANPGTAPVKDSAGGAGTGTGGGSAAQLASTTSGASGADAGTGADAGVGADAGADAAAAGAQAAGLDPTAAGAVGPTSGPFNGWVQDPNSGNLVDPTTGREVNAGGQFLDPVTGQPFGDATQNLSRLEGLQGGVGTTGGLFGGGVGAFAGATGGVGGLTGGGGGGFAGLYGGMIPPSLMGSNPAMGQLQAKANQNLQAKAAAARGYSALMTGQEQARPYMPPMGGAGGGMGGGGRSGRPSRRLVSEPSNVWGATGRGDREGRKRSSAGATELVEDADVWTGGEQAGSGLLDR